MSTRDKLRAAILSDTTLKEGIRDQIDIQEHAGEGELKIVKLERVQLNPHNPRKTHITKEYLYELLTKTQQSSEGKFGDDTYNQALLKIIADLKDPVMVERLEKLYYLAESIQNKGLIQPISIMVQTDGAYQIVAGERRFLAHLLMGRETIRAIVREQSSDELSNRILSLLENINREDLSTGEKIDYIEQLVQLHEQNTGKKINAANLSLMIHESQRSCRRYLRYLAASEAIREQIRQGQLSSIRDIETALKVKADASEEISAPVKELKQRRSGRKRTSISLGRTEDVSVVQTLAEALIKAKKISVVPVPNWNDYESVQSYWDLIIEKIIEGK